MKPGKEEGVDEMDQLDQIDTTLKSAGANSKGRAKNKRNHPDITGMSSGKKDKDEEAMLKDFGDVGISDREGGTDSAESSDDDGL